MSFEDFYKKPIGRDISEEQETVMDNLMQEKINQSEIYPLPSAAVETLILEDTLNELEIFQNARLDLIQEMQKAPTLSNIINNPEKYIDDTAGKSVEDIQKWIDELNKEIYMLSKKIIEIKNRIEKVKQIENQNPELN